MLPVWGGIYSELKFLFVLRLLGENWKLKMARNRKLKKYLCMKDLYQSQKLLFKYCKENCINI